jgi:hypothetical protein
MGWIDKGYDLVWVTSPPKAKEMPNSKSAFEHHEFVTKAVAEMVEAGAASALPTGVIPTVVSPLGVVPKPHSDNLRLIVNMRYVNEHLVKRVFKFEGLTDIADMANKGDYSLSYDLTSGYYHVALHPDSRRFVGFKWEGTYYQYNCLPFGLSTAPWVFSKVIRELVMFWRAKGINILPYLDDFLFLIMGYDAGCLLATIVEEDMRLAGLAINQTKSDGTPKHARVHLGFDVDLAAGLFRVPLARWEALRADALAILNSKGTRVQARKLACLVGTVISMKLAWGPITQLYTRNIYHILNDVPSLNCWVTINDEAHSELLFWSELPRLRFEADIWPCTDGVSIKVATDASDFGWGGHTLGGTTTIAHEYFSEWEAVQSSTYRELLGVTRCIQSLIEICKGKTVVVQVDAMNLLGIVNRGSPRLALNILARELFWFCLSHRIVLAIEWVPRENNTLADDISKWLIPDDFSISRHYFAMIDGKWGPHTCDAFSSNENNHCSKFYSLHWCRGTSGVNSFVFDWSADMCWIHPPFRLIGKVWRKLVAQRARATIIVPLWTSSTWWHLIAPDAMHLSNHVVDWMWLPRNDGSLFVPGQTPGGRVVAPPDWQVMAFRVDFSSDRPARLLSKRERCIQEGCSSCSSNTWRRSS